MSDSILASTCQINYVLPALCFSGHHLFRIEHICAVPRPHAEATVKVIYDPSPQAMGAWNPGGHSGPGIYACFWDDCLFYVGTFAGTAGNIAQGNVAAERWLKHVAGMTFRGYNMSICERWLDKICREHCSPLANLLIQANQDNRAFLIRAQSSPHFCISEFNVLRGRENCQRWPRLRLGDGRAARIPVFR